jgi:L-alanine-DL-glutamate epimerase-like enolase superfamily enzyme
MERRSFLKSLAVAPAAALAWPGMLDAALPKAKIIRVRIYTPPRLNPSFNQSDMIVTIETDAGLTGIGEGGVKDTLEQCAGSIIGQNPFQIERLWRKMYMEWFYPPGREKIHALGAIDLALWDIKGKALGLPVHDVLGGAVRNFCECYPTSGIPGPAGLSLKERAAHVVAAGYRCYRVDASIGPTGGLKSSTTSSTHTNACARLRRRAKRSVRGSAPVATGASTCTRSSTIRMRCAAAG